MSTKTADTIEKLLPMYTHKCVSYHIPDDMLIPWMDIQVTLRISSRVYNDLLFNNNVPFTLQVKKDSKGRTYHTMIGHDHVHLSNILETGVKVRTLMKAMMWVIRKWKLTHLKDEITNLEYQLI